MTRPFRQARQPLIPRILMRLGILATPEQSRRFDAVDRELDALEEQERMRRRLALRGYRLTTPVAPETELEQRAAWGDR